ncbi:hypothetical protein AAG906_031165 [Vitis piasezkii]
MSKVSYASAIGSLIYAMVCIRPDIAHAVGVVSRFMSRPGKQHWEAVKWILRYLKGSLDTCLCFTGASLKLQGYVVQLYHGLQIYRRLLLCLLQKLSMLQQQVGKEMIWLHGFLDELGKKREMSILYKGCECNISCQNLICGSKNPIDMLTKGVTIEKLKLRSFNWSSSLRTGG